MVVYFPKNGRSVMINTMLIGREGLPCQFPVQSYENFVNSGLLVKRPQDMDPLPPEQLKQEISIAKEKNVPVYIPEEMKAETEEPLSEYDIALINELNKRETKPVEKEELTYELAESYVKKNEDGSLKVGKDGDYVLTPGAKPFSKAEICEVIKKHIS